VKAIQHWVGDLRVVVKNGPTCDPIPVDEWEGGFAQTGMPTATNLYPEYDTLFPSIARLIIKAWFFQITEVESLEFQGRVDTYLVEDGA
jgi:hypothetical protein